MDTLEGRTRSNKSECSFYEYTPLNKGEKGLIKLENKNFERLKLRLQLKRESKEVQKEDKETKRTIIPLDGMHYLSNKEEMKTLKPQILSLKVNKEIKEGSNMKGSKYERIERIKQARERSSDSLPKIDRSGFIF